MNQSSAQLAARARAHRRKRMQQRQTVIFGSIIAVLLAAALFAGAVWAEIVPAPFTLELKRTEPQETLVVTQPCPPEGAVARSFNEVSVNVLNSTSTAGLGARTAEEIGAIGLSVESVGNADSNFLGSAKIVSGIEYLDYAYTVADLIADSQVVIDGRTEPIVDVIIGSAYTEVRGESSRQLSAGEEIPHPAGCAVVDQGEQD